MSIRAITTWGTSPGGLGAQTDLSSNGVRLSVLNDFTDLIFEFFPRMLRETNYSVHDFIVG